MFEFIGLEGIFVIFFWMIVKDVVQEIVKAMFHKMQAHWRRAHSTVKVMRTRATETRKPA